LEVIKEPCDICHVRRGYDFVIKPQKPRMPHVVNPVVRECPSATASLPN
jgi:hypothetical protein